MVVYATALSVIFTSFLLFIKFKLFNLLLKSSTVCVCSVVSNSFWNFPGKNIGGGLPFPTPGDLPDRGVEPESLVSLTSLALAGRFFTYFATWEALPILSILAVPLTYSILKLHNSPHTYL